MFQAESPRGSSRRMHGGSFAGDHRYVVKPIMDPGQTVCLGRGERRAVVDTWMLEVVRRCVGKRNAGPAQVLFRHVGIGQGIVECLDNEHGCGELVRTHAVVVIQPVNNVGVVQPASALVQLGQCQIPVYRGPSLQTALLRLRDTASHNLTHVVIHTDRWQKTRNWLQHVDGDHVATGLSSASSNDREIDDNRCRVGAPDAAPRNSPMALPDRAYRSLVRLAVRPPSLCPTTPFVRRRWRN